MTLTRLGADQIGVKTEPVQDRRTSRTRRSCTTPTASRTSSSTSQGLSFHREDIAISTIAGDTVDLAEGPADGTQIVTVGVPQIHGAELEFGAY